MGGLGRDKSLPCCSWVLVPVRDVDGDVCVGASVLLVYLVLMLRSSNTSPSGTVVTRQQYNPPPLIPPSLHSVCRLEAKLKEMEQTFKALPIIETDAEGATTYHFGSGMPLMEKAIRGTTLQESSKVNGVHVGPGSGSSV